VAFASSVAATLGIATALTRAEAAPSDASDAVAAQAGVGATSADGLGPGTAGPSDPTPSERTPGASADAAATNDATYADGTYTGTAQWTRWGYVQVRVTIEGGRIVATDEVQAPDDGRSRAINGRAQPILESEAVAAQSADIDGVSGATFTSETYRASLQAALDQAATS
jgi:uncharacterized protein with FMN-binding domain